MSESNKESNAEVFAAPTGSDAVTSISNTQPNTIRPVASTGSARTIDESHGEENKGTQSQKGMVFEEQTEMSAFYTPPNIKTCAAQEPTWNMQSFFELPVRVASGTWSTTQPVNTILKTLDMPTFVWSVQRWMNVINRYTYYKFKVRVRIELNGTAFHAGKLLLSSEPYISTTSTTGAQLVENMIGVPHVTLYPAYNNVAELDVPWISAVEYYPTNMDHSDNDIPKNFSRVVLTVFNQLTTGVGGSTALNWTIYASLHDVELYVPIANVAVAQGLFNYTSITNQITKMENSTMPQNIVGDEYDMELGLTGLDLPADQAAPHQVVRRATSNNHQVRGFPSIARLSLYPESQVVCSKYNFETSYDEMNMKFLLSRWQLHHRINLATTHTFGKIIYQTPLNLSTASFPGAPAFACSFFKWWKGDIELCVEIIGTQYHTAKIFCGVSYGPTPPTDFAAGESDPTTHYGKVIEINKAKSCFKMRVPYQFGLPWAQTAYYPYTFNNYLDPTGAEEVIVPVGGATPFPYKYPAGSIGTFFVCVLNPLVVPSNVATNIDINVYSRGADNFELSTPFGSAYQAKPVAQAGELNNPYGKKKEKPDQVGMRLENISSNCMTTLGERTHSLRDFVKRFHLARMCFLQDSLTISAGAEQAKTFINNRYTVFSITELLRTGIFNKFSSCYRAYCGDMRIKIIADTVSHPGTPYSPLHVLYVPPCSQSMQTHRSSSQYLRSTIQCYALQALGAWRVPSLTTVANAQYLGYPDITGSDPPQQVVHYCTNPFTAEILTHTAPAIELEIPYCSPSRYCRPLPAFITDDNSYTAGSLDCEDPYGHIIVMQIMPQFENGQVPFGPPVPAVSIFIAGGDTFRYAQFVPPLQPLKEINRTLGGLEMIPGTEYMGPVG